MSCSELVQVILDDYTFNPTAKEDIKNSWNELIQCGFEYNIVSVLGPQSGGKSTLLNLLFNTNFPEMDVSRRKQTTKG